MITVWVTHQFQSLHAWRDIPEGHPKSFLRYPHRHLFHARLEVEVTHTDREVELLLLQDMLNNFCLDKWENNSEAHGSSCEDMASAIYSKFVIWGYDVFSVSVSEDHENGATIKRK